MPHESVTTTHVRNHQIAPAPSLSQLVQGGGGGGGGNGSATMAESLAAKGALAVKPHNTARVAPAAAAEAEPLPLSAPAPPVEQSAPPAQPPQTTPADEPLVTSTRMVRRVRQEINFDGGGGGGGGGDVSSHAPIAMTSQHRVASHYDDAPAPSDNDDDAISRDDARPATGAERRRNKKRACGLLALCACSGTLGAT
jgi:hypothetical protein